MTASDLAAVLLTVAGIVLVVIVLVVGLALLRTLREARSALRAVHDEVEPLVAEMRTAVIEAGAEVDRVDAIVERAEDVTATLEASSRVVDAAVTSPLIKLLAAVRGVGRGLRATLRPRRRRAARRDVRPTPAEGDRRGRAA